MDFGKLKLIIWDLDDTFWDGTLSEGGVKPIDRNITMVRNLTDRGIVNTICSKNDVDPAVAVLKQEECDDLFVFKSIDWTPKGQRIVTLIKDMGLQPKHCLFIDDNPVNLNEAKHYSSELNVAEPSIIDELIEYVESIPISDPEHRRLANYKVLEQKQQAKASASDNLEFLYDSNTQVEIHHDCIVEIDRIHELVNRTNQLNYTKVRSTKEELIELLNEKNVDAGYVKVRDKYGDYGIVGFYAMKGSRLLHFLFSCRTIGQGVEQYVYAKLGYPQLDVIGDVVNYVTREPAPLWINQDGNNIIQRQKIHKKVVFKGGCDFKSLTSYLNTDNVIEEFTYIGRKRHNNIELISHSVNYLSFPFLSQEQKQLLLDDCLFADEEMFNTAIYDNDVSIVFLSTLIEPNLGIYQNKKNGMKIAFGEYSFPLTDSSNWELYVDKKIFTADNDFTLEWLQSFSEKYEFLGCLTPQQILNNAEKALSLIKPPTKVCYLLGSETPFLKNSQQNYDGRELVYKEINSLFRNFAQENDRVLLIDFNDYIHGQSDFNDNINHFIRRVYYDAATKANEYISAETGERLEQKGIYYLKIKSWIDDLGRTGFYQTPVWSLIRKPYIWLRTKLSQ